MALDKLLEKKNLLPIANLGVDRIYVKEDSKYFKQAQKSIKKLYEETVFF